MLLFHIFDSDGNLTGGGTCGVNDGVHDTHGHVCMTDDSMGPLVVRTMNCNYFVDTLDDTERVNELFEYLRACPDLSNINVDDLVGHTQDGLQARYSKQPMALAIAMRHRAVSLVSNCIRCLDKRNDAPPFISSCLRCHVAKMVGDDYSRQRVRLGYIRNTCTFEPHRFIFDVWTPSPGSDTRWTVTYDGDHWYVVRSGGYFNMGLCKQRHGAWSFFVDNDGFSIKTRPRYAMYTNYTWRGFS